MTKNAKKKVGGTAYKGIHTKLDEVQVERYTLNDDDYNAIAEEVKGQLNIKKTAEEFTIDVQNKIEKFMDEYFKYNPDNHVRCAYAPNYEDKQRVPLEETEEEDKKNKNYERTVIPPDDTFFRWKRYAENNYEYLRQATDDIYCEKSDFEMAIVPLETFESTDEDTVTEEFNKFKRKYADEFDSEIFGATYGRWNLLSSWEQNREIRDFYTEKTEIIKRIIDQHKSDERLGTKLMKDRMNKKKQENETKDGAHDPALQQYRKALNVNKELEAHGGKHSSDMKGEYKLRNGELDPDAIPRDTDPSSEKNEIEMNCTVIKPYFGGGRRRIPRAMSEQFKFNLPAVPLKEDQMKLLTVTDFHDKNKDGEELNHLFM